MELPTLPFTITDWDKVEPVTYPGETGEAVWRTFNMGEIRVRVVDYSPGYLADHWCDKGHILYVLEGELTSELKDGRRQRAVVHAAEHVSTVAGIDSFPLIDRFVEHSYPRRITETSLDVRECRALPGTDLTFYKDNQFRVLAGLC